MKRIVIILLTLITFNYGQTQENIDDLLAAGIADAKQFSTDYLNPATEGIAYSMNNGWFNNRNKTKQFSFELSVIANVSFIMDEKKSFVLNVSDYENVKFEDGRPSDVVATALGHNEPDITVIVTYDDPIFGDQEVELTLPTGIGSENINLIPTAYVQASFSIFKGTQIKGRFFPNIKTNDAEISSYGLGLQQEFTAWLPADKLWPVSISGLAAYTQLKGNYDFTDSSLVEGEDQHITTKINTVLLELIAATRLKIINFYAAIGYINGTSKSDLLGTYVVSNGSLFSEEIVDPFSVEQDISGIRTTLGANLKVGFFGLNVDYSFAEFNSASLGINFSF